MPGQSGGFMAIILLKWLPSTNKDHGGRGSDVPCICKLQYDEQVDESPAPVLAT